MMSTGKEFHIFTVGVSILQNSSSYLKDRGYEDAASWSRLSPTDEMQRKLEGWAYKGAEPFKLVCDLVKSDPKGKSAELNAFLAYLDSNPVTKDSVEIGLYTTDTGNGWFCGMVLYEVLKEMGFTVNEPVRVKHFGLGPSFLQDALAELMDKIARVVVSKKEQGLRVCLNATGGYKPEVTFAVITSLALGVDRVYYIHEGFRDLVVLPSPPLTLRKEVVEKLRMLFENPEGLPKHLLIENLGWKVEEIDDLIFDGLVEERDGIVKLRRWVRKLMELAIKA